MSFIEKFPGAPAIFKNIERSNEILGWEGVVLLF
jgi:hypothetical protein